MGKTKRNDGGWIPPKENTGGKPSSYTADSKVVPEAEEKKKGGRVKRARGGKIDGMKAKERMDRPKRASGGRVGSDKSPFTSAAHLESVKEHHTED